MRTLARHALRGFTVGAFATTAMLLALPHFYSHAYELALVPVVVLLAGLIFGALILMVRALRRRPRPARAPVLGRSGLAALSLGVVLAVAAYALRAPARSWRVSPRLIILCIDGGTWDVIDPLIAARRMPTMARLKREGTASVLMSTDPAFSMVVWTTIGTGVGPEEHGIQSFYDTADHLRAKRFWEVFEESGHSVGLFRWWVTWPPRVKNGFVIPDILARDDASVPARYDFINRFRSNMKSGHHRSLAQDGVTLFRFLRAGLRLETCLDIGREMIPALRTHRYADIHIATRRAEIRVNADVYAHLLRSIHPEYTCFYDNGVDQMCHFYWQYYEPGKFRDVDPADVTRYGSVIPDYYALNDKVVGDLLAHVDTSATVVVLSDHGFAAETTGVHPWFFPRGVPILADLGMDGEYFSVALASRTFVHSVRRDPVEARAAFDRAVERFNALTVYETGTPLFKAWLDKESYVQLDVSDSLRSLEGHVQTPKGLVPLAQWFDTRIYGGTHHPAGMIAVRGRPFRAGRAGATASIVDVAPTVLYATGFPLSRELDGSVVWDWITDAYRHDHETVWIDSYGHPDTVRSDVTVDQETLEKLRSLGYVH